MSISYATSPFSFVDSQFGTAATSTGIKVNVPVIFDTEYHRKVQVKTFFAQSGLIGQDTYKEGNYEVTAPGFPIIRKTDFQGKKGDTIIMHQRTNLAITPNVGKVGANQIVDAEVGWDMNYKKVKIEQWRQAVRTDAGMNVQRNPVNESFVQTEDDLLSNWTAQVEDSGVLAALHYGHAHHLFRQYGTSNLVPTANPNTIFGNDNSLDTTRTIANLVGNGDDNIKARTFQLINRYMNENFIDPIVAAGSSYWACLVPAAGVDFLYRDTEFRQAMQFARERGIDNPLFKLLNPILYHNCLIFTYEKIRTVLGGNNPAGLTVSNAGATNSSITEAAYTGIGGGVTSSQLCQIQVLGANAVALAEGRMRMGDRTENNYGQIIGRDADNIWGASRMDWYDQTGALANNQGSANFVATLV